MLNQRVHWEIRNLQKVQECRISYDNQQSQEQVQNKQPNASTDKKTPELTTLLQIFHTSSITIPNNPCRPVLAKVKALTSSI
ncbi:hypothetical protein EUGRSUZ_C01742 [Eucalyptus grandis]|uniref:Uncharacterized protein n=2 Tax=Eucalyptus grandis TaxID=71139 RepID=A0ACC3LDS7_EUCGR|nr:hypothetical protein EUGRSUZ_C01742 [Eucalyptus grandis]